MVIKFKQIYIEDKSKVIKMFQAAADKIKRMQIDHWQYWNNPPSEKIKWLEEGIANFEYFFIQNEENETIGMVRILDEDLMYWGKQKDKAKYIHSLVVKEKFNRKGVVVQILEKVAKQAQKEGCNYIRLDADSKNPKLCRYYEKQGFQNVGAKQLNLSTYKLYQKALD